MPLELRWWQECLFDGQVGRGVSWDSWAPVGTIYDAYEVWARKHTNRSLDKMEFGRRMAHLLSAEKSSVRRFRGQQHHAWNLRTLGEARKAFDVECASETDWPEAPLVQGVISGTRRHQGTDDGLSDSMSDA